MSEAFTTRSRPEGLVAPSTASSFLRSTYSPTKLNVGANIEPEEVIPLGQERIMTPEGYGFASPVSRILKTADRQNGYYRASTVDLVTDVMEAITHGPVDVALVFDEDSGALSGIFTETDYIKVHNMHSSAGRFSFV